MKYFPQTISAAKEIEEERKQEEKAKLKAGHNDVEDAEENADDVEENADDDDPLCHPFCIQEKEEEFGEDRLGRVRTCLWDLLEYPETSKVVALVLGSFEAGYERQWNYYCKRQTRLRCCCCACMEG